MTSFSKRMGGDNKSRVAKIAGASAASSCHTKGYAAGGLVGGGMSLGDAPELDMDGEDEAVQRLDRPSRLGKKDPKTIVNINVGKQDQAAAAPPAPMPPKPPMPAPPMAPPMGAMPPPPAGMPPMGGAPGAPGPLPPLPLSPRGYKSGGKVKADEMTAGAGSGVGRLQKIGK